MAASAPAAREPHPRRRRRLTLTRQILVGLALGCLLGWWLNGRSASTQAAWNPWLELLRDIFLHLIKLMIAPLVFGCVVQGIAGTGDMKKVGRIGAKTLLYFEIVTTAALVVGLAVVNLVGPGRGVRFAAEAASLGSAAQAKPLSLVETILHIFPTSVMDAMARRRRPADRRLLGHLCHGRDRRGRGGPTRPRLVRQPAQVMFKFAGIVMIFAPLGVGAAIAVTVGHQGLGALLGLGKLVLTLYFALACFHRLDFRRGDLDREDSAQAVRPRGARALRARLRHGQQRGGAARSAFAPMERFGVPRGIVGFVLPMGYSFNLDGIDALPRRGLGLHRAGARRPPPRVHFGLGQQITMMLTLMLTSKGVAAVPRASLVVLIAALQSFSLPLEGAAMILGVDAFMDMARTSVNVLGNCLASVVVARWEGEFDDAKAKANFGTYD